MKIHAWVALAALTPACAATPTYRAMLDDVRHAEPPRTASADDERALGARELDRAAYVRAVLDRNPSLESARAAWRAALARVRGAGALDDPTVSLSFAPLSIGSQTAPFGWEASISQRFPWPEKLSLDADAAKLDAEAERADFETTRLDLALGAARFYDAYYVAVRSLEVNGAHVALVRDLKDAATAHYAAGRGSAADALQAELELAHLEHESVELATDRNVVVAQMNELLHRAPDAPLPPPPRELAVTPAAAEQRRWPEVDAAKLRGRAEETRARRAKRDWVPDLTVMTSYDSMWDMPEHRWMLGVSLELPLEPARRAGALDLAEAERARWAHEAERLTDEARTKLAIAVKRRAEAAHVLELYERRLLPIARSGVDAARAGYVASQNDFAAVIAAERSLRSVELGRAVARARLDTRTAELDRARGVLP